MTDNDNCNHDDDCGKSMSIHTAMVVTPKWNVGMLVTIGEMIKLVIGNGKATTHYIKIEKWICYQRNGWSLTDEEK